MDQLLLDILWIQSYSGHEKEMNEFILHKAIEFGAEAYELDGNVYVTKGKPLDSGYPCIVAHTDTVHKIIPERSYRVLHDPALGIVMGFDVDKNSVTGIGGDDKVGIYIALKMIRDLPSVKSCFFMSEEIGCIGSGKADLDFFNDAMYILQCDRRGNNDFITDIAGPISSEDFQNDVKDIIEAYGYRFFKGMTTDVGKLVSRGVGVSTANMSCGYYNPHCDDEVINLEDVDNTYEMVWSIMTTLNKRYDFTRPVYTPPVYSGKNHIGGYYGKEKGGNSYYGARYYYDRYHDYDDYENSWPGYRRDPVSGAWVKEEEKKTETKVIEIQPKDNWDDLWEGKGVNDEDLYKHFLMVYDGYEPVGNGVYKICEKASTIWVNIKDIKIELLTTEMSQLTINNAWDDALTVRTERASRRAAEQDMIVTEGDVYDSSLFATEKLCTCWGCGNTMPKAEIDPEMDLCYSCSEFFNPKK